MLRFLPVLMLLLAGCATVDTGGRNVRITKLLQDNSAPKGEIFGSLGWAPIKGEAWYANYVIHFCRVDDRAAAGFAMVANTIWNSKNEYDFNDGSFKGVVFHQSLPEGEYHVCSATVSVPYPSEKFFRAEDFDGMQFTVRANESIYLGRFTGRGRWAQGILGNRVAGAGYFEVSEHLDQDMQALQRTHAQSAAGEVKSAGFQPVVNAGSAEGLHFRRR